MSLVDERSDRPSLIQNKIFITFAEFAFNSGKKFLPVLNYPTSYSNHQLNIVRAPKNVLPYETSLDIKFQESYHLSCLLA